MMDMNEAMFMDAGVVRYMGSRGKLKVVLLIKIIYFSIITNP